MTDEPMKDYYAETGLPEPEEPVCPIVKHLAGQKAIVTGASSGIGRAVAVALGHAGADVLVNYSSRKQPAEEVAHEVEACGAKATVFQCDVSREEQVLAMFEHATATFGRLDVVVSNAGIQLDAPFHELTVEQWDRVMGVNLRGQFLCAREAVKRFMTQGVDPKISSAAGKIICMSSVHDVIPWAGHVNYAASKGGVLLMMKSLAQEVAPQRIRVNGISPGAIRTPINKEAWSTREAYNDLMRLIPYKRIGEPVEVGRAAVWLASDQSDYVNGITLYVDGGMTLYPGFETGG